MEVGCPGCLMPDTAYTASLAAAPTHAGVRAGPHQAAGADAVAAA